MLDQNDRLSVGNAIRHARHEPPVTVFSVLPNKEQGLWTGLFAGLDGQAIASLKDELTISMHQRCAAKCGCTSTDGILRTAEYSR